MAELDLEALKRGIDWLTAIETHSAAPATRKKASVILAALERIPELERRLEAAIGVAQRQSERAERLEAAAPRLLVSIDRLEKNALVRDGSGYGYANPSYIVSVIREAASLRAALAPASEDSEKRLIVSKYPLSPRGRTVDPFDDEAPASGEEER